MKIYSKIVLLCLAVFALSFAIGAQETGGLKGRVRAANGNGIAAATVTARQNGENVKSAIADAKGNFVLDNLKAGEYTLVFSKSGYSSGILTVEVKKNKTRDLGGRLALNVDQGSQIIIKGAVFDNAGRSVAGAKVDIEKISSDGSIQKIDSTYTSTGGDPGIRGGDGNARGEFTFRFSESTAIYRVTVSLKDSTASKQVEVSSAGIYRLAITLN